MTGRRPRRKLTRFSTALPGAVLLVAILFAGCTPDMFSDCPPAQLDPAGLPAPLVNPTVEERIAAVGHQPGEPFRFVAFGDQKHLLQDHFPPIRDRVTELAAADPPLLLVIDTGDIVQDGRNGHEFECLREAIEPLAHLPYLLAVGNHEIHKTDPEARRRVAALVSEAVDDPSLGADRLYYEKRVDGVRFLFLDTNDLVYDDADPNRARAQIQWLDGRLAEEVRPTVVLVHHPFIQSSKKHAGQAVGLWNRRWDDGRTLPERLIEGGVDLVISGHVHSHEAFRLDRGGRTMWSLNASGMPNSASVLGWQPFKSARRPHDWRSIEAEKLHDAGYGGVDPSSGDWTVAQIGRMAEDENQFAAVTVDEDRTLHVELKTAAGVVRYGWNIPDRDE